jgi:acetoin:2,6-dichlorophenolindophenol oxidoreductase subunit beta
MKLRMRQAVAHALADAMERDDTVVVFGEDVAVAEGPFKTSEGLLERFGPLRVRDTPISEMGFLGLAVGAAACGLRPVAEIMFVEFVGVALDQLTTEAAFFHYLSNGELTVPLVVRASVGSGLGFGLQHSRTLEQWLLGTPGLKVVSPSDGQTAYGLLRSAIDDDNPVVVLEPRALYAERFDVVTGDEGIVPLGRAAVVRPGSDVTIVALGQTTGIALAAATDIADVDVEVVDLRTLVPWDRSTVLESVARTKRLVVVEESPRSGGWGSEICAEVTAELFGELAAPPVRITCPDVPVPYPAHLERMYLPQADEVARLVGEYVQTGRQPAPWWQRDGMVT